MLTLLIPCGTLYGDTGFMGALPLMVPQASIPLLFRRGNPCATLLQGGSGQTVRVTESLNVRHTPRGLNVVRFVEDVLQQDYLILCAKQRPKAAVLHEGLASRSAEGVCSRQPCS